MGRIAKSAPPRKKTRELHDDAMLRMANAVIAVRRDEDPTMYWGPYRSEDEWYEAEVEGPTEAWIAEFRRP